MGEFGLPTRLPDSFSKLPDSFSKVKIPESGSADKESKGEVGGAVVLPMLRLGDGSRFPSLGSEPFVFILGP